MRVLKRFALASIIGATVAWCVTMGNYVLLKGYWEQAIRTPMIDEAEVLATIEKNAPKRAMYLIPAASWYQPEPALEDSVAAVVVVVPKGLLPMSMKLSDPRGRWVYLTSLTLVVSLIVYVARSALPGYWHRVSFVMLLSLLMTYGWWLCLSWWFFPPITIFTLLLDETIAMFSVALVVAHFIKLDRQAS